MYTIKDRLQAEIQEIKDSGLYKNERVITSPQGADITLADGRSVINFCANNYLGLSSHPKVIEAAKKAKEEADAIAAAASSTEKNLADAGTVSAVKSTDDMTKNEIIVLLDDYNETAEAKIDFKASESKEILYNKYIATNQK